MKRVFFLLAIAALTFALPAPPLAAQTPIHLEVSGSPFDLNGPLFYAQDLGFFKKAGLDVHIQPAFANVESVAAAMLAGTVDIGSANTATLAQAHLRGIDFRFFAPSGLFTEKAKPTEVVAVLKSSPVHTAADLNGKIVAVAGIKSMLQIATVAWADKHGGNGRSLQFVEIPFPQMDAALAQHRVDAVVFTEPYGSAASADTRVIGSAEDGVAPEFMTLGWFAPAAWLNTHVDAATRFIAAIREGAMWGNAHHKESAEILSKYSKMSLDVVDAMGRSTYGITLDPKLIQAPIDVAARYGYLDRAFPASEIIWTPPGNTSPR